MNIKSLLLGSAAALAAVSGAQAADAIVAAEPEPMEYVRVCDAFGTGYFYIPGTETCLKIGGYVRMDVGGGDLLGDDSNSANGGSDYFGYNGGDEWNTYTRFTLNLETATDTELGALKTFTEVRFHANDGSADDSSLKFAYIDLAGFRVGKTETAFYTFVGYAGNVIHDDVIPGGVYDANVIQYNYDSGTGFTGVISLEDTQDQSFSSRSDRDYVPNVVGGLGYTTGAFGIRVVGGYDAAIEEGAIKARLDASFGGFSAFVMGGWNTDGDRQNVYANWFGDWAVWLGASAPITETISLNGQVSFDDAEELAVVLNAQFNVVPGFLIQPEIAYYKEGDTNRVGDGDDSWGGMVRFQRSF
ncbi:MAG: porin [Shinella sp.]|nr:porin [Shinella sp.]